jgi:hypothetical protein
LMTRRQKNVTDKIPKANPQERKNSSKRLEGERSGALGQRAQRAKKPIEIATRSAAATSNT